MKQTFTCLGFAALLAGCQAPAPKDNGESKMMHERDSIQQVFDRNAATVLALTNDFIHENVDYSKYYADSFNMGGTLLGSPDLIPLDSVKAHHQYMWQNFDFYVNTDSLVLLPGVNADSKMMDGSVRYYAPWKVSIPGTDSSDAKSGEVKLYETFEFNKDGKIYMQQYYGDVTALVMQLTGKM
jgi:hypothetical protein